jgi:nitrite reductase/ring-hydroxylating ferredoxin subunit
MKYFILLLTFLSITSCKDDFVDNNKYLPNIPVNFTVDLNLPEANSLLITGGYAKFTGADKGIRGVIVFNNGLGNYVAFDLACPHIPLQDCSTMTFNAGDLYMKCPCDDEKFSKLDGSPLNPNIHNAARMYLVEKSGNTLLIHN